MPIPLVWLIHLTALLLMGEDVREDVEHILPYVIAAVHALALVGTRMCAASSCLKTLHFCLKFWTFQSVREGFLASQSRSALPVFI
jgi:hypothetical protein